MEKSPPPIASTTVKAGKQTFFVDLVRAKTGNLFVKITESRIVGDLQNTTTAGSGTSPADNKAERERKTILVFEDHLDEFAKAVAAMSMKAHAMRLAGSKK